MNTCEMCSKKFKPTKSKTTRFCSIECRAKNQRQNMATGTLGALNELVVCTDLMKRGYDVYRSMSPNAASDLIVSRGEVVLKIEVKTRIKNTELVHNLNAAMKFNVFDVLAIVDEEKIYYMRKSGEFVEL